MEKRKSVRTVENGRDLKSDDDDAVEALDIGPKRVDRNSSFSLLLVVVAILVFVGFFVRAPFGALFASKQNGQIEIDSSEQNFELTDDAGVIQASLEKCSEVIEELREMRKNKINVNENEDATQRIEFLQYELRKLIPMIYGMEPYFVEMNLTFPTSMPDFNEAGANGRVIIELGPVDVVPYSVFYFLHIVRNWKGGAFHRWAGHVLQAQVKSDEPGLAFQEYNPAYPHNKLTLGFAGRPGGPAFYISTVDNVANHGPGSQGSKTEADSCFGQIANDHTSLQVVERMKKMPGAKNKNGFVMSKADHIVISSLTLLNKKDSNIWV